MPDANFEVDQSFKVQFVWQIPAGDFLRAIFDVDVLALDPVSGKYVVLLKDFLAGRQESADGEMRPVKEVAKEYWALVAGLTGRRISLAYEADDGRPLWLRLETLTGEHNFFRRLTELPPQLAKPLAENARFQEGDELAPE
ncbi:MAG: hypothetical protein JSW55_15510 [Chloroflexota bacterium]|nr:MAG: hypothetical protein JSW55_15510 [Chloroflexota bacterium]